MSDMLSEMDGYVKLKKELDELRAALSRISHAKPDRLDHSVDIAIIERAAKIAREALERTKGEA